MLAAKPVHPRPAPMDNAPDRWIAMAQAQARVTRLIAAGAPLADSLSALMQLIEELAPGRQASVLLLDADGQHLRHGAAPSLPSSYTQAIDGAAIGPAAGSCGTAAWRREPVVVEDIASDPLWADYRQIALPHGLRACWSTPITDAAGAVLGTFAIYRDEPSRPEPRDHALIELATQLATIAIVQARTQAARQHDLALLEGTLQHIDQGVLILDADARVLRANQRVAELLDYPPPLCAPGTPFAEQARFNAERGEYGPGDPAELAAARCARLRADRVDRFVGERPDGRVLDVRSSPLPGGGFVVSYTDISERARSERAALRFRAALDLSADGIFLIDARTLKLLDVNDGACRALGWRHDELVGRSVTEVLTDRSPEEVRALYDRLLAGDDSGANQQARHRRRDGSSFVVEINRRVHHSPSGPLVVAVARDITAQLEAQAALRRSEEMLRESQKMEAIGTLASGIAHDFNNIIPAILGNAELARGLLAPGDAAALPHLEQIVRSAERARSLVQQILAFSRREGQQRQPLALAPLVADGVAMLRVLLPAGAALTLRAEGAEDLWVEADATRLHQVLMNLCTNAWHALPRGAGHIEVGLAPLLREGRAHAHLWVRDDGTGMDAATLQRIFEPFFTTKDVGQGTGLGLAVAQGIVAAHGGLIEVDSVAGQGSCFHVLLPTTSLRPAAVAASTPPVATPGHGRRLLCVDDDDAMRELMVNLLQREGWQVLAADSVAHARELLRHGAVDVVVTDNHMPGESGLALARELARRQPGLPVVLSSGFIDDTTQAEARAAGVRALLRKEHTLEELPALLRRLFSAA